MNTVFVFIHDIRLKLLIIRILVENNIPFFEASNMDEALFKLDLVQDVAMMIEEFQDGEKGLKLIKAFTDPDKRNKIPIIWIIPANRRDIIPLAAKWQIADLITMPLDETVFLRKISGGAGISDNFNKKDNKPIIEPKVLSYHSQNVIEALESAEKGKYPISIISLQVNDMTEEANKRILGNLKSILRGSDSILGMDLGQYLILLPFTPKASLPIVESKVKDTVESIVGKRPSAGVHIYGVCFPDDVQDFDELTAKLTGGIEQSIKISKQANAIDSNYQRKLLKYQKSSNQNKTGMMQTRQKGR
jgi:hypothetical protein